MSKCLPDIILQISQDNQKFGMFQSIQILIFLPALFPESLPFLLNLKKKMLSLSIKGKELKVISRKFVSVTPHVQYITNSIKSIPRYMWNQSFFSTSMLIYCHIFFSSPNHLLSRPLWSIKDWWIRNNFRDNLPMELEILN